MATVRILRNPAPTTEQPIPRTPPPRGNRAEDGWRERGETRMDAQGFEKDLRAYDEHVPESSIEILGHAAGGITYRHYAHRALLAFNVITTLPVPQLTAFLARPRGFDGQCRCCRRSFVDAT